MRAQICKATAAACEAACKERCREWSISLPRRPRGPAATYSLYPHIYAVRQRACRKCGRRGEFHMRTTSGRVRRVSFASVMQEPGLLCKRCALVPRLSHVTSGGLNARPATLRFLRSAAQAWVAR